MPSGAAHQTTFFGAPAAPGMLRNNTLFLPWGSPAKDTLTVTHEGSGKPWLTLQSLAAVQLKAPFNAGYQISKTITPVEQAVKGQYTRGDVLRITLEVNASADMTWVAITDPIPGGATILGSGLGRDSQIATSGEKKPLNGRRGLAGVRGTQLRGLPQLLRIPAQGRAEAGLHRAAEQRRQLRPAPEPRRSAVRARDVWRSAECAREGGGGEVNLWLIGLLRRWIMRV